MKRLLLLLILAVLISACNTSASPTPSQTPTPELAATPSPTQSPTPTITPTPKPDARARADAFLAAWKADDYPAMYGMLSAESQAALTQDDLTNHMRGVAIEAALESIDYEIQSVQENGAQADARYKVTFHSNLVPEFSNETGMTLLQEDGEWRVKWEDTLVMSQLSGANYLSMNRNDYTPERGVIYDRNGNLVAGQSDVYAVGLDMLSYNPEFSDSVINTLARLTGVPAKNIENRLDAAIANATQYLSFGEYPLSRGAAYEGALNNLSGAVYNVYNSRFYFGSPFFGAAPHVLGYVGQMDADQVDAYRRLGFRKDELIGQSGLEKWAEERLLGKRGGALYVRDENNQVTETLAENPAVPSQNITTTLDMDLQMGVQNALSGLTGAAVVLERDTGRVLAMASSPSFNPNGFNPASINSFTELSDLNNPLNPLYNRATQGQYPLGSVFKIISMAAALESGVFNAASTYDCGYLFTDIPGVRKQDWTYEHFLEDGETQPSGLLTLPQGLIRSCNPWFYHIGQVLYDSNRKNDIANMARAFGLGSKTGIQGVDELAGNVPDPTSIEDAIDLATGQSQLQVTPLQVARFIAAVGNGGTLYTPQVIERIAPTNGEPSFVFSPQVSGTLPVSAENLKLIQDAMLGVTTSRTPRGTAEDVFRGFGIPVHGKTGTAQTGVQPHAWFAAYTDAGEPNRPDIAVAVIVENGGEGSEWAAPIARRIMELYYLGRPGRLYPWEESYGVWATPEPPPDEQPTPEP
jgi:cell division protein FtsI/penicillin-binding protein 2